MPKYRQLHVKILDSLDVNDMPDDFTRLTWVLLPLILDCEGRGVDNPAWVRAKVYPLREDVGLEAITVAMDYFKRRGMIHAYSVEGRNYFQVCSWHKYQSGTEREAPSSIPSPDELPTNSGPTPDLVPPKAMQGNAINKAINNTKQGKAVQANENLLPPPSSVFTLYEHEIGLITPKISDKLAEAEKEYPFEYLAKAITEAAFHNKRNWAYVETILKRYKVEGIGNNGNHKGEQYEGPNGELRTL